MLQVCITSHHFLRTPHTDVNTNTFHAMLTTIVCSQQHYDEAVTLLNKAIKSEKKEKGLYVNRGGMCTRIWLHVPILLHILDCFYHMRNLLFALADYKQALELDQNDWSIASRIAVVCCEIGVHHFHEQNMIKAKDYLSEAINYNPYVSSFYVYRATVLQALKVILYMCTVTLMHILNYRIFQMQSMTWLVLFI